MSNNILEDRKARGGYPLPLLKECFSSGHLMEETRTFGDWLKAKRKLHYLTQEGLAAAAGGICTGAYISTLEKEVRTKKTGRPVRPDERIVEALAVALGESVDEARAAAGYAPGQTQREPVSRQSAELTLARGGYLSPLSESQLALIRPLLNALDQTVDALTKQIPSGVTVKAVVQTLPAANLIEEAERKRA